MEDMKHTERANSLSQWGVCVCVPCRHTVTLV